MVDLQTTQQRTVTARGGKTRIEVLQTITVELNGGGFVSLVRRRKARSDGWRNRPLAKRTADTEAEARANHAELARQFGPEDAGRPG